MPGKEPREWLDEEETVEQWSQYRTAVANHFQFDQSQVEAADKVFDQYRTALRKYFSEHKRTRSGNTSTD